jgi:hypothetical protein
MTGKEEDVILLHQCGHLQNNVLPFPCLHKTSALRKFPSFTSTVHWGEIVGILFRLPGSCYFLHSFDHVLFFSF